MKYHNNSKTTYFYILHFLLQLVGYLLKLTVRMSSIVRRIKLIEIKNSRFARFKSEKFLKFEFACNISHPFSRENTNRATKTSLFTLF